MLFTPSFITANFVARQLDYNMRGGWGQGEAATIAWFSPLATFEARFEEMLLEIKALGFKSIDLWCAHLHWRWATPLHIELARGLLAKHGLNIASYAAWVPGDLNDLRGACLLCETLSIPNIAGAIPVFQTHRAEAVALLRKHGVVYAHENHKEKSTAEVLAVIGTEDTDVVGLALDTGWCATQKWDAADAVASLVHRIKTLHVKDVLPPRAEKTGLEFVDMGHETCAAGEGVVPFPRIFEILKNHGYRGTFGVEHEPETHNPTDEIRRGLQFLEKAWADAPGGDVQNPLRIAVVGCGNIANAYGEAFRAHKEVVVLGAYDLDSKRAEAWTAKNGGKVYPSLGDILADPSVEAVVNLTLPETHEEVISKALLAGKHVHTEKPLTPSPESSRRLVALAAERGLRLSCAPVTWLGEPQQTAWKLVRDGKIGKPRVAHVNIDWARIETWHPNPESFYNVGPMFDVGVYPITLLTAWFGPVSEVSASGKLLMPDRSTKDGKAFTPKSPDWIVAVLSFRSGFTARVSANYYVGDPVENRSSIEVHGDAGSVSTDWLWAGAAVKFGAFGGKWEKVVPLRRNELWCDWAAGVVELWRALRTGAQHPTSGEQGAHVVEVITAIHDSLREGKPFTVGSTFPEPSSLTWAR